jgi:4-hydroxybenzoate polyprenyltransferase
MFWFKVKIHCWTLPRHFALPFFLGATLLGVVLAGEELSSANTILACLLIFFIASGGHSFNTYLDTVVTKLDDPGDAHSVEKAYSAGSVVINEGWATPKEVLINALSWYVLALIPGIWLAITATPWILIPLFYGMAVTFMYSPSKFTFLHEVVLASGPVAGAAIGALSTGTGQWVDAVLVSIPLVLIFSFAGLAIDEYPDAAQNLAKGVKSMAYRVYECGFSLPLYVMLWIFTAFLLQILFIVTDILKPLTSITFILLPFVISASVFLGKETSFKKAAMIIVAVGMLYPFLLLVGQVIS